MSELAYNKGQSSKCPFYADCVCNSDSDDTNTVISDESCSDINIQNSLNSGSEFEEFLPTKGLIQYHAVILKVKFNSSSSKVHRISKLQYLRKYQIDFFRKYLIFPSV